MTDELKIEVNLDAMTIDDLVFLEEAGNAKVKMAELKAFLDRVVVGGVGHLPIKALKDVAEAITDAVQAEANPTTDDGKN